MPRQLHPLVGPPTLGPKRWNQWLSDMGVSRWTDAELVAVLEVDYPERQGRTVGNTEVTHLPLNVSVQITFIEQGRRT